MQSGEAYALGSWRFWLSRLGDKTHRADRRQLIRDRIKELVQLGMEPARAREQAVIEWKHGILTPGCLVLLEDESEG